MDGTIGELEARRRDAIDESGWGGSFRLLQPRNACMWVYLAFVLPGVFLFVGNISGQFDAYGPAIMVATASFALYGALFWWFTQRIDRYSNQPLRLLVAAFVWGGFAATWPIAAPANDALRSMYAKLNGQAWMLDWGAGLAAPFTEEISKGMGLLLLMSLAPHLVRTAFDGFVLGAFIGLGFQILEDVSYAMISAGSQFGANQVSAEVGTIVLRMSVGVAAHILYSAIFCTGLVYLLGTVAQPRRVARALGLMVTAMVLHGIWDSVSALARGEALATVSLLVGMVCASILIVMSVFRMTVGQEREYLRNVLEPELAQGVIDRPELDAATGSRRDRRRFTHAVHGRRARRTRRNILEALFDLADELARTRGRGDRRVEYARDEVVRLRHDEEARVS